MSFRTHIPRHPDDPNTFEMVRAGDMRRVTSNFTANELFNPKNGIAEHPIATKVVQAMQYIRSTFGEVMNVTSTYRTYVPVGGVSRSPHMLAEAIDAQITDLSKRDAIMVYLREDFDSKGSIFRTLFNQHQVRGFGIYDTFIHLDVVPVELYADFRNKRTERFNGFQYAYWNNMKRLRYQKSTLMFPQSPVLPEAEPITVVEEIADTIETEVRAITGSTVGWLYTFIGSNDDGLADDASTNVVYALFAGTLIGLLIYSIALLW